MARILVLSFFIPLIISLLMTPVVMKLAKLIGAIDKPDARKIHKAPMPRLGGLAAYVSFILTIVVFYFLFPDSNFHKEIVSFKWIAALISLTAILILGICDDVWMLKPGKKFLVQFVAGALVYFAGFRFSSITNPFGPGVFDVGIFSFPLTVLWVVGITNAFNLIDGLDGLASGIAMISALTIAAISAVLLQSSVVTIFGIILAGSLLGFLRYNFNPAKIFLGDTGSLFLGFSLAVLSIEGSAKGSTTFSLIIPLFALGVPIFDTLMAMLRRILRWFLPEQDSQTSTMSMLHSMFLPDRKHLHHQLLSFGLSQRASAIVLYFVSFLFGAGAFLVSVGSVNSSLIIIGAGIIISFAVRKLGYKEIAILKNGILLKLYSFVFLRRHSLIQIIADSVSVTAAMFLSIYLSSFASLIKLDNNYTIFSVIGVSVLQMFVFSVSGLYKHSIPLFGIGDFLQIVKKVLAAVIVTIAALIFIPFILPQSHIGLCAMMDFYFLMTFIVGTRVSFHALNYIFNKEAKSSKKVLIYGADQKGLITLQALLRDGQNATPIGFLDDDPNLEGKYLNGYPIYGGHWKLEGLLKKNAAHEIILAKDMLNGNIFGRVKRIANQFDVPIRTSKIKFKPIGNDNSNVNSGRAKTREIIIKSKGQKPNLYKARTV